MLPLHKACRRDSVNKLLWLKDPINPFGEATRRRKFASKSSLILMVSMAFLVAITTMTYRETTIPRRNPFQTPRRRLEEPTNNIRLLSLGGASTWGVGLLNPEPVDAPGGGITTHDAAYPYRLTPDARNAAQRVGGPTLAALCTQSIVEDSIYDVITLEFSSAYQESDLVALDLLAQRLRTRFPNAFLVVVQLWSPSFYYYNEGTTAIEFASWRQRQDSSWDSTEWQEGIQGKDWKYSSEVTQATDRLQKIADQVKGYLVHMAPPKDPIHGLQTANTWFVEMVNPDDGRLEYTLSSKGHMVVANHIRSVVDQAKVLRLSLDQRNVLGNWGSGDKCQLWYDYDPRGEESSRMIPVHSSTLSLRVFGKDKHSLEVRERGGSIIVDNPFDEDRMLYLTYMTTSVSSPKGYPKVQVKLYQNGEGLQKGKGVVIDPYHNDEDESRHVTRTTAIGNVPPHSLVEMRIQPLESTVAPFRLVGASFLAKEKVQWQIATDSDLQPERVRI